jgi:hypothetical protein
MNNTKISPLTRPETKSFWKCQKYKFRPGILLWQATLWFSSGEILKGSLFAFTKTIGLTVWKTKNFLWLQSLKNL